MTSPVQTVFITYRDPGDVFASVVQEGPHPELRVRFTCRDCLFETFEFVPFTFGMTYEATCRKCHPFSWARRVLNALMGRHVLVSKRWPTKAVDKFTAQMSERGAA